MEQAHATEKRLTTELSHTKEFSEVQLGQLRVWALSDYCLCMLLLLSMLQFQSEIEMLQSEQSKLVAKHKKLLSVHQVWKLSIVFT